MTTITIQKNKTVELLTETKRQTANVKGFESLVGDYIRAKDKVEHAAELQKEVKEDVLSEIEAVRAGLVKAGYDAAENIHFHGKNSKCITAIALYKQVSFSETDAKNIKQALETKKLQDLFDEVTTETFELALTGKTAEGVVEYLKSIDKFEGDEVKAKRVFKTAKTAMHTLKKAAPKEKNSVFVTLVEKCAPSFSVSVKSG